VCEHVCEQFFQSSPIKRLNLLVVTFHRGKWVEEEEEEGLREAQGAWMLLVYKKGRGGAR